MVLDILGLLVVGLIIGALARLFKPGKQRLGLGMTLLLGVVGAIIGGLIASFFGAGDVFELNFLGFVLAVVAAVLLIGAVEGTGRRV